MDTEPPRLLPASVMGRRLGVTTRWLIAEVEEGRLPGVKTDKTVLFDPAAVQRVLLERAQKRAEAADG